MRFVVCVVSQSRSQVRSQLLLKPDNIGSSNRPEPGQWTSVQESSHRQKLLSKNTDGGTWNTDEKTAWTNIVKCFISDKYCPADHGLVFPIMVVK